MAHAEPLLREAPAAPDVLQTLVDRYDPGVFSPEDGRARIRLGVGDRHNASDVLLSRDGARLVGAKGRPDALVTADLATWTAIAGDVRGAWTPSVTGA